VLSSVADRRVTCGPKKRTRKDEEESASVRPVEGPGGSRDVRVNAMPISDKPDIRPRSRNVLRVLVCVTFLTALFGAIVPCAVLAFCQILLFDNAEYSRLLRRLPRSVLIVPALLGTVVALGALIDYLRRRGPRAVIRLLPAMFLLNVLLAAWYWGSELRSALLRAK